MRPGRSLVLTDPTLLVRLDGGRLVCLRERQVVAAVPLHEISHLCLHGPVTLTGAAVARLLDEGIDMTLYSSAGRLRGMLSSVQAKNVYLLLAQVAAWNDAARRIGFARPLLYSKLMGQRRLVQRHALDHGSAACAEVAERIGVLARQVLEEADLEALQGLEGAAAAAYFGVFGQMLRGGWTWPGRVRRPPRDPVNALLSFGYTLAAGEVARCLLQAGFDLRIGLLHGIRYGRESLPLDLLEELRAPLVDRFTLRLLNRRQLGPEEFEEQEGGAVRLTAEGRRKYLELWEEALNRQVRRRDDEPQEGTRRLGRRAVRSDPAEGWSWRRRMERQVQRLRRYLLEGVAYRPLHPPPASPQDSSADP
ncbi:MAG: CRISPR-associated endonuclease Cas1 [Myxococcales bacterium]|nr:CRISPR-associated endonuclease Cas1 [Myxococcota bacterium]MDW8284375.1 CRISPR-associated endonuclease Cas1 [Myxococcales bacterium]